MSERPRTFTVRPEEAEQRVDRFVATRASIGRAEARRLCEDGAVRVDGRRVPKARLLRVGEVVALSSAPHRADFDPAPDPAVALDVRYEDESFVIVEKPAGMPCHPLDEDERGTLAQALLARYPEMRGVGHRRREPGLVHRIDNDTSGLVLAARSREAFERAWAALREGAIEKEYVALAAGPLEAGAIFDAPLAPGAGGRVVTGPGPKAKSGRTTILRAEGIDGWSKVVIRASPARRHQIRAHLAAAGAPLVGDILYGGPPLPDRPPEHSKHLLHASRIAWTDGVRRIDVSSPLPPELAAAIAARGKNAPRTS